MKKLIALLSVLALTLLASCGGTEVETPVDDVNTPANVEVNMEEPLEINAEDVVPTEDTTVETTTGTTMEDTTSVEVTATGVEVEMVK
ncbi:MAG: hypothetical protein PHV23_02115 [Candidatus Gracilibacteria bacterium]|nr:hypothetical protein [Candidatus Gracilibacteria bacterium]